MLLSQSVCRTIRSSTETMRALLLLGVLLGVLLAGACGQSRCGSCAMREEIKRNNLEAIKREVLSRMGFSQAPNVTGKTLPHVRMQYLAFDDHGSMQGDDPFRPGYSYTEEEDDYHVKTEKVLMFAQPSPRLRHTSHDTLHFVFSDSITKYHVANATLFVYVRGAVRSPAPQFQLEVRKVFRTPDGGTGRYMVASRRVQQPRGRGDWLQIDITETVGEWFKAPEDNLGFAVSGNVDGEKVVITDQDADGGGKTPYVEIATQESKKRFRRSYTLNCDDNTNQTLCCRYSLEVNFEEFGWDFIIAPKKYDAHYCSGDCPFMTLQKHPHTHLMNLASQSSGQPCCTPRKMNSINMLYFDSNLNVMYGTLPGMVVEKCGCS